MSYVISHGDQVWKLNPQLASAAEGVGPGVEREVRRVVRDFGRLSSNDLLDYVYQNHPAFTVNSDRQKLAPRPKGKAAVYTAGYEGKSIDGFLNLLVEGGIIRFPESRT
jgi:hypothetical protein